MVWKNALIVACTTAGSVFGGFNGGFIALFVSALVVQSVLYDL